MSGRNVQTYGFDAMFNFSPQKYLHVGTHHDKGLPTCLDRSIYIMIDITEFARYTIHKNPFRIMFLR